MHSRASVHTATTENTDLKVVETVTVIQILPQFKEKTYGSSESIRTRRGKP